jgi:hypothetical protein
VCQGIAGEFAGIDLGDRRLNGRAVSLLERLSANPQASVNAACQGWSETQAAYRFFDNDRVEPSKLLEPHRRATEQRIAGQPVVLLIQDTTELDYSAHPAEGVGLLNKAERRGLYDHSHIAFTPERLCLGVLGVEFFSRTPETLGKAAERKSGPIETKESFRWLQGYRLACELSRKVPDTQVISVADREADIYDVFLEAERHATPAEFIIRAKIDRSLPERDLDAGPHAYRKVRDAVEASAVIVSRTIELPQTPQRKPRQAKLEIRANEVVVKPPHVRGREPQVTLRVVLVQEVDGPRDGTAVDWLLATSLPIDSARDVLRVVDYYGGRWAIEVFFRVFKTGCRVEDVQLESVERLQNCLMLYKIIAWRVMYLTYLGRECPEAPCTTVFAEIEWRPAWKIVTREEPPADPPSINQFLKVLAQLGGYNARKKDRPPGPQHIWVGVRRMTDFAIAWTAFQENY